MLIITTLYLILVWLLFFKFKWLPWNTATQWLCLLVGAVILTGFLVGLQSLTPSSSQAVLTARIVEIAPAVSGPVTKVPIEAMKPVEKDDVLFEIDPTEYQSRLDDLEAQLVLARIREDQASTLYERQAAALATLQQAEAQVGQLEAKIEGAQFDLDNTTVRSPINTDNQLSLWEGKSPDKSSLQSALFQNRIASQSNDLFPAKIFDLYNQHEKIKRLNESLGYRS